MEFTKEIVGIIEEINNAIESEMNLEELSLLLKEKSELTGIHHSKLLRLACDKDNLFDEVYLETTKIDKKIKTLENELDELTDKKYQLGSLICQLHGHVYHWEAFEEKQECKYCGEMHYVAGMDVNHYLRKIDNKEIGIYKSR